MDYKYSIHSNESNRSIHKKSPHGHAKTMTPPPKSTSASLSMSTSTSPSLSPSTSVSNTECNCNGKVLATDSGSSINPREDLKIAGMKIFATVMLHAWRRRREDVRRLMERVEDLKQGSMKAKNQVHVYNTLFRIEQKRNDELQCQLKNSEQSITKARSSCEDLTTTMFNLQADNSLLKQEVEKKTLDLDALNAVLAQTKSDLFRSMSEQRRLQTSLSREQRNMQILDNQKNKLVNEICSLNCSNRSLEDKYERDMKRRDMELAEANEKILRLEGRLCILEEKSFKANESLLNERRLQLEIDGLRAYICKLEAQLKDSTNDGMNNVLQKVYQYQQRLWHLVHVFMHFLLPGIPPPKSLKFHIAV